MAGIPIVPPQIERREETFRGSSILAGTIALAACGWLGARFARDRHGAAETSGDRVLRSAPLSVKTKERSAV